MYVSAWPSGLQTGLTPTIRIRDLADNSLVVTDAAMAEVGDGGYKYDFAAAVPSKQYQVRVDWGASFGLDRYDVADLTAYAMETTAQAVPGLVWDEPLTGATHNLPTSAGRRLRQVAADIITEGTAQGAGSGTNTIRLAAGASSQDGAYDPGLIYITAGAGAGQSRIVLQYEGATRTAVVNRDWKIPVDATSEYVVAGYADLQSVNEGLVRAATANTVKLNANAATVDGTYVGQIVFLVSGTGADQTAIVKAYDGATQTATIAGTWKTTPDATTGYVMVPVSPVLLAPMVHDGAIIPRVTNVNNAVISA